jgi:hypothetical protein
MGKQFAALAALELVANRDFVSDWHAVNGRTVGRHMVGPVSSTRPSTPWRT